MTGGQLRLATEADLPPAPELAEYDGLPVTWLPWEAPAWSSLVFHVDTTCDRCGEDLGLQAHCAGTVPERRRLARPRERGYGFATTPEVYPVRALMAFRCAGCGAVDVVAHDDPSFWWRWGGPGALPVGVMATVPEVKPQRPPQASPAHRPGTPPRPADAPVAPPASEETRRAARAQLAAELAAKRARPPLR